MTTIKKTLRLTQIVHYDDVETGILELNNGQGRQKKLFALWASDLRTGTVRQLPRGIVLPVQNCVSAWSYDTPLVKVTQTLKMRIEPLVSNSWQDFGMQFYVDVDVAEYRNLAAMIQRLDIRWLEIDAALKDDRTGETYFKSENYDKFWE